MLKHTRLSRAEEISFTDLQAASVDMEKESIRDFFEGESNDPVQVIMRLEERYLAEEKEKEK